MNTKMIPWLAGLVEGEGSFIKRHTGQLAGRWIFTLEMTDEDVVVKARDVWGYGSVRRVPARQRPKAFGTKDLFVWRFEKRSQVYAICAALYQFMGTRRQAKMRQALMELPPVYRPRQRDGRGVYV